MAVEEAAFQGRVLIAGCGDVGIALGTRLAGDGSEIFGLRRSANAIPPPLVAVAGDLTRPEELVIPPDLDAVVYTATASGYHDDAYRLAYVQGVSNLLAALAESSPKLKRFLFVSSTSVYGHNAGEWVDESTPTVPKDFSGRRLLEGEALTRSAYCPGLVVRFGGIYGPGRNRLIEKVRRGESCQASPAIFSNRIHRDDCAGVLAHLLTVADPAQIYVGVDDAPTTQCEIMDWIALALGVPAPARAPASAPRRGNKRCSNKVLRLSGYRFLYPTYREGYGALLSPLSGPRTR